RGVLLLPTQQEQVAVLAELERLTDQLLEPGVVVDRGMGQARVGAAAELLPDAAGGLRGRALAEQSALEHRHVGVAVLREMECERYADDPTADDDDRPT